MTTLVVDSSGSSPARPIAPLRRTLILVAFFLAIAVWGAVVQGRVAPAGALPRPSRPALVYLSLIAMEWGLVLYVWRAGLRRSGASLRQLIGGRWGSAREVATDVLLALGIWLLWTLADLAWERWAGPDPAASVGRMLPRSSIEILLWIVLSSSAGFCEELVFRGYLQTQLRALTGRAWIAVVLQSLLFGVSHGYQGVRACLKIAGYGALLGVVALRRKSLRPGMVAHAWTDVAAGIFRI